MTSPAPESLRSFKTLNMESFSLKISKKDTVKKLNRNTMNSGDNFNKNKKKYEVEKNYF